MLFILILSLLIILILWLWHLNQDYEVTSLTRKVKTVDGTPLDKSVAVACGFWGNSFDLISMDLEEVFDYYRAFAEKYKHSYIQYFLTCPVYNITDPINAELILSDNRMLTKGIIYKFLQPFLKTGLLTSTDKTWHTRRRLLTPAFHFNILKQFIDTFKRESLKFIKNLNEKLTDSDGEADISLSELIPRFTLNTICETALGVSLDDHLDGDDYRKHIEEVEESFVKRVQNPLMAYDKLYYTFGDGKNYLKAMENLHRFSSGIIEKRRFLMETELRNKVSKMEQEQEDENIYSKQRHAMLDTLLRAEKDGLIDHAGICEEVDTFMFEGFDTTSMNLIFSLMNLALHPDMQQKCLDEIETYINDDLSLLDIKQLNNLKYLDCFMKETQRLYPSAPTVTRECTKDLALENNLLLPKGTQVNIHIFDIHRNPDYYDDPNEFRPERFMAPEVEQRHPFAFIPFSAGQRNCIGQKFVLLEIKTLLVYVLKHFKLEAKTHPKSFKFSAGVLIRTRADIQIKIKKRI